MKRITYVILLLLILLLVACTSTQKQNYKNINWNATLEKIEKLEEQPLYTNDNTIFFTSYIIYDEEARIEYLFIDDSFTSIDIEFLNPSQKLFDRLIEKIKSEYNITWESIVSADKSSTAMFETKNTDISLSFGDNYVTLSFSPLKD